MAASSKRSSKGMSKETHWFGCTVHPMESVKKYSTAPPKGMTNPPQNPAVRAALLQDIKEYGTQLEYSSLEGNVWPPPHKRSASTSHAETMNSIMSSSMRSSRMSFGSTNRSRSMASTMGGSMFASTSTEFVETVRKPRKPKTTWKHVEEHVAANPELDFKSMSSGNGTCRWRTAAGVEASRKRAEELAELKALRAQGLFNKKIVRVMEDREVKNHVEVLKAQSAMHAALVGDRFRFSHDTSKFAPMVISGSGSSTAAKNDVWGSDIAHLLVDHNGAMRLQSPSTLQRNPEELSPKHGRKKKKPAEDDLQMGQFKPIYPLDESLKTLRRIKKKHFPETEKKEDFSIMKAPPPPTAEEKASASMREMGGLKR